MVLWQPKSNGRALAEIRAAIFLFLSAGAFCGLPTTTTTTTADIAFDGVENRLNLIPEYLESR